MNHFLVKQYKETRYKQTFVMYSAVIFYVMRSLIHLVIQGIRPKLTSLFLS